MEKNSTFHEILEQKIRGREQNTQASSQNSSPSIGSIDPPDWYFEGLHFENPPSRKGINQFYRAQVWEINNTSEVKFDPIPPTPAETPAEIPTEEPKIHIWSLTKEQKSALKVLNHLKAPGLDTNILTPKKLKKSYRHLAKKLHPDINKGANTLQFHLMRESYLILKSAFNEDSKDQTKKSA